VADRVEARSVVYGAVGRRATLGGLWTRGSARTACSSISYSSSSRAMGEETNERCGCVGEERLVRARHRSKRAPKRV
jgi:hypothetical protein